MWYSLYIQTTETNICLYCLQLRLLDIARHKSLDDSWKNTRYINELGALLLD